MLSVLGIGAAAWASDLWAEASDQITAPLAVAAKPPQDLGAVGPSFQPTAGLGLVIPDKTSAPLVVMLEPDLEELLAAAEADAQPALAVEGLPSGTVLTFASGSELTEALFEDGWQGLGLPREASETFATGRLASGERPGGIGSSESGGSSSGGSEASLDGNSVRTPDPALAAGEAAPSQAALESMADQTTAAQAAGAGRLSQSARPPTDR